MNDEVRKRVIRAAVAWERRMHEQMYPSQNLDKEIKELIEAVQSYTHNLLLDDVGSKPCLECGMDHGDLRHGEWLKKQEDPHQHPRLGEVGYEPPYDPPL